ncbi:hypothetical protein E3N88_24209 [Mikania micrantha]|uniref:Uncharacterized protein n=1 Tax=Mikania micrantha TaxID=192012 RepID=A0A5N6NI62_9ASTR|nr:hypothetical protein E3N88_24209 [Mikania micrantha]
MDSPRYAEMGLESSAVRDACRISKMSPDFFAVREDFLGFWSRRKNTHIHHQNSSFKLSEVKDRTRDYHNKF